MKDVDKMTIEQLRKEVGQKKSGRYSKKIVALVIVLITVFTTAFLYAFIKVGSEPSVLIGAFYGWAGYELWSLKDIKKTKIKHQTTIIPKGDDLSGD